MVGCLDCNACHMARMGLCMQHGNVLRGLMQDKVQKNHCKEAVLTPQD